MAPLTVFYTMCAAVRGMAAWGWLGFVGALLMAAGACLRPSKAAAGARLRPSQADVGAGAHRPVDDSRAPRACRERNADHPRSSRVGGNDSATSSDEEGCDATPVREKLLMALLGDELTAIMKALDIKRNGRSKWAMTQRILSAPGCITEKQAKLMRDARTASLHTPAPLSFGWKDFISTYAAADWLREHTLTTALRRPPSDDATALRRPPATALRRRE